MMLNEYWAGRRPESRPGPAPRSAPSGWLLCLPRSSYPPTSGVHSGHSRIRPRVMHEAEREGFTDEGHQQSEQLGHDDDSRLHLLPFLRGGPVESPPTNRRPAHCTATSEGTSAFAIASARDIRELNPATPASFESGRRNFSHTRTASLTGPSDGSRPPPRERSIAEPGLGSSVKACSSGVPCNASPPTSQAGGPG